MQPRLHTSTAIEYNLLPSRISGARYHKVTTLWDTKNTEHTYVAFTRSNIHRLVDRVWILQSHTDFRNSLSPGVDRPIAKISRMSRYCTNPHIPIYLPSPSHLLSIRSTFVFLPFSPAPFLSPSHSSSHPYILSKSNHCIWRKFVNHSNLSWQLSHCASMKLWLWLVRHHIVAETFLPRECKVGPVQRKLVQDQSRQV